MVRLISNGEGVASLEGFTMKLEPVINLHFYTPCVITTEEYEQIVREVVARTMTDTPGAAERILSHLLVDNQSRYYECKDIKGI